MIIDFNTLKEESIPQFKGGDLEFNVKSFSDGQVKIMKGRLDPGASIGVHTHTDNSEVIFVLSGQGTDICDGKEEHLTAGMCHYCPKGSTHTLRNTGNEPLVFYAVVE